MLSSTSLRGLAEIPSDSVLLHDFRCAVDREAMGNAPDQCVFHFPPVPRFPVSDRYIILLFPFPVMRRFLVVLTVRMISQKTHPCWTPIYDRIARTTLFIRGSWYAFGPPWDHGTFSQSRPVQRRQTMEGTKWFLCRMLTLSQSYQVLFKRKPVQYLPRPVIEDDSSEVRTTGGIRAVTPNQHKALTRICDRSG